MTSSPMRHAWLPVTMALVLWCLPEASGLTITSSYSPRNKERPRRRSTDYIILHTTEGPKEGSLRKVQRNGEAHYLLDQSGHAYRVVHRSLVAYHAGRSMWDGHTNLDTRSLGIEVVGYHNRDLTSAQYAALRELLDELQRIYKVPDRQVLTHSMVAYGTPNRWHRKSHRGRKRCAMGLATHSTRRRLGLTDGPTRDPDVAARRLVVADPYLTRVLYGSATEQNKAVSHFVSKDSNVIAAGRTAWDIARDRYRSPDTVYALPGGKTLRGNEVKDWKAMPAGTRVTLSADYVDNEQEPIKTLGAGRSAHDIAGDEARSKSTLYCLPDGTVKRGNQMSDAAFRTLPPTTRVLLGYVEGGRISAKRSAFDVCGPRWDDPATLYRLPDGTLTFGTRINENKIPAGTQVFFQN